ncbi:MAG: hypothetical protein JJ899_15230, partial [Alphaproteobacteria bacterium]|nr:hypothetical protein [Alphaproteobacteria bacterium]
QRPFRFGSDASGIFAKLPGSIISYECPGPFLNIHADGRLTADRPHTVTTPDVRVANTVWQSYGSWKRDGRALLFDFEAKRVTTELRMGTTSSSRTEDRTTTLGVGGEWVPRCTADGLVLSTKMFIPGDPPHDVRRFIPAP